MNSFTFFTFHGEDKAFVISFHGGISSVSNLIVLAFPCTAVLLGNRKVPIFPSFYSFISITEQKKNEDN